ncbi:uncharacterized protein LOC110662232 isoform X2 [Hevea brasiliensis]|nr:uncharacterized protein LOC110662232 isoform X2 [Hevea brasiliensis]
MLRNSKILDCWSEICDQLKLWNGDSNYIQMTAFILWHIWESRNLCVQPDAQVDNLSSPMLWRPPPSNGLKTNFDAAADTSNCRDATAVVVRDDHGRVVDWSCKIWPHILDPHLVESLACLQAVDLAKIRGFSSV